MFNLLYYLPIGFYFSVNYNNNQTTNNSNQTFFGFKSEVSEQVLTYMNLVNRALMPFRLIFTFSILLIIFDIIVLEPIIKFGLLFIFFSINFYH
jgi:hypothetical protein